MVDETLVVKKSQLLTWMSMVNCNDPDPWEKLKKLVVDDKSFEEKNNFHEYGIPWKRRIAADIVDYFREYRVDLEKVEIDENSLSIVIYTDMPIPNVIRQELSGRIPNFEISYSTYEANL